MYVRQFGYRIVPGHEEKAIALCSSFADVLRQHGVVARVLVGDGHAATLQLEEEYDSLDAVGDTRKALESDERYHDAVSRWAVDFYPLVQSATPAVVLRRPVAA